MTRLGPLPRRALGALCLAALGVLPAACGDDDSADAEGTGTTTTTTTAPEATLSECAQRFVDVTRRDDLAEAVRSGNEMPADAEAAFEAVDAECGDELDRMVGVELDALIAAIDPAVLEYIEADAAEDFQQTGDTIAGLDG